MGKEPKMGKQSQSNPTSRAPLTAQEMLQRPGISPDELYLLNLMPVSRNGIYSACSRGEIECFRIGRRIIIPTAPLRRKLGIEAV
jgi:hypothetical protein